MEGCLRLNLAQMTGVFVAFIYGLGTELDLVFAVPVGFLSGVTAWAIERTLVRAFARVQTR
jgi:hypothetical protein